MASSSYRRYLLALSVSVPTAIIMFAAVKYDLFTSLESPRTRVSPTLEFVIIFARHGNRAPYRDFPTYPYPLSDTNTWPYGRLQLSRHGRSQMYKLGAKFRLLYNGFLSQNYKKDELKAQTTLTDRTMMSAQLFLAGLYPPQGYQQWNGHILWQPVPVFPTYLDNIKLTAHPELCPVFHKDRIKAEADLGREYGSDAAAIMKTVEPYTGEKLDYEDVLAVRTSIYLLWDTLNCAESEGLPLPAWTKKVYRQPLENFMLKVFLSVGMATDEMISLLTGELFQEVIKLMQDKVEGELRPDRRLYFYSGHDYTILGLLGVLGLCQGSAPLIVDSGSALIFELHRHPQSHLPYVQVLYIDGLTPDLEPKEVNIPGCDFPCGFDILKKITEKYYNITNWEEKCTLSK
uniref:Acid phosphatase n=1 Tax=Graphocephala atropunctata TaxID=36148 RepID=A0A1B6LMD3_9HEMI